MKPKKSLGTRFSKLMDYLIVRRAYLVESGLSQRPESHMRQLVDKFRPYKGMKWTDQGAAMYLQNHYYDIRQMVPARETKIMDQLEVLYMAAKNYQIINQKKETQCS